MKPKLDQTESLVFVKGEHIEYNSKLPSLRTILNCPKVIKSMSNKDITFKSQEDTFEGCGNKAALENS